ncbi:uncharacterized protein LOC113210361 [Frankliniella occidentalis]|uniref:Uncharacterized protein LOC113210361 n=1 Tax=Frankliniella occidentalis TaxID=133901 RepID=A0A6J1SXM9_FRAOC|nr:uncharacterized protein LOC113210361 [Frankliniella occidentalis]
MAVLEAKIRAHLDAIEKSRERIEEIMKIAQNSWEWLTERRLRLTASNFGPVCRRSKLLSVKILVHHLLYTDPTNKTKAMEHGSATERTAREHYEAKHGVTVRTCGLVLDQEYPFLAASPDGFLDDDTLLEIKCPTSGVHFDSAEEAVRCKKLDYLKLDGNGALYPYERSDYNFQIQGQLHITGRSKCVLYIYQEHVDEATGVASKKWDKEILITRNDKFWAEDMEPHLVQFYKQALVPELVCPRANSSKASRDKIREAPYVLEAIAARKALLEEQALARQNKEGKSSQTKATARKK